jgi:hypothetical protein
MVGHMTFKPKTCVMCGKEFVPYASCQKTCSKKCGRDNTRAYARDYYREDRLVNPEKYNARERAYYARNPEYFREKGRAARARNPGAAAAATARWRERNPEYIVTVRQLARERYKKTRHDANEFWKLVKATNDEGDDK